MDAQDVIKIIAVFIILLGNYMDPHNEINLFIIRFKSQWLLKAIISLLVVFLLNLIFKNDSQNEEIINEIKEYDPKKWTESFPSIWEKIKEFLTEFFDGILKSVEEWAINASNSITNFFNNIGIWFLNLGTWFVNFFGDIGNNLKTTADDFSNWLGNKSAEFVKYYVLGIFIFIAEVVRDFVIGFFTKVLTIPGSIIKGIVYSAFPNDAIKAINFISAGYFDKAVNEVANLVNGTFKPVSDELNKGFELIDFEDYY